MHNNQVMPHMHTKCVHAQPSSSVLSHTQKGWCPEAPALTLVLTTCLMCPQRQLFQWVYAAAAACG
jgi:hypothetical protein